MTETVLGYYLHRNKFHLSRRRGVMVENATMIPLGDNGIDRKSLITGTFLENSIAFVERYDNIKDTIKKWRRFRKIGLPVVSELALTSSNTLLIPDLKANGSEMYGHSFRGYNSKERYQKRERPRPEIDKIFISLTEAENLAIIERKAREYADLASRKKILLPRDDPFELVVQPDGSWELVILDLEYADIDPQESSMMIRENNQKFTNWFLDDLKTIGKNLSDFSVAN